MENRDFKGVWIPKEIWLNPELTLLEKALYTEISSLDNENHCTAGNDYFAKFCNCSESSITKAIKKLQSLNMIEVLSFDGRHRTLAIVKNYDTIIESRKIYEAAPQNLRANNINNNTNNNIVSKDTISAKDSTEISFDFGLEEKPIKKNLYQKCLDLIDEWTNNNEIRKLLKLYLDVCMEMKSIRGANQWKGMLNTLEKVQLQSGKHTYEEIIEQSINHSWKTFYPIDDKYKGKQSEFIHIQKSNEYIEPTKEELEPAKNKDGTLKVF